MDRLQAECDLQLPSQQVAKSQAVVATKFRMVLDDYCFLARNRLAIEKVAAVVELDVFGGRILRNVSCKYTGRLVTCPSVP